MIQGKTLFRLPQGVLVEVFALELTVEINRQVIVHLFAGEQIV